MVSPVMGTVQFSHLDPCCRANPITNAWFCQLVSYGRSHIISVLQWSFMRYSSGDDTPKLVLVGHRTKYLAMVGKHSRQAGGPNKTNYISNKNLLKQWQKVQFCNECVISSSKPKRLAWGGFERQANEGMLSKTGSCFRVLCCLPRQDGWMFIETK